METQFLFEYTCPECDSGTVRTTKVHNFKTKIKGYPFIVDEAFIGVCDHCHAEQFAPEETRRWEDVFRHSLEAKKAFLSPDEIAKIRNALSLSMEDFARLVGCTRQSISAWEKQDRTSPPSRTADLLMKLVRRSLQVGPVDIVTFLLEEAKKWGIVIEVRRSTVWLPEEQREDLILLTKRLRKNVQPEPASLFALAAEAISSEKEEIVVETSDGKQVGLLEYDYERGALILEATGGLPPWKTLDVEFETSDGRHFAEYNISVLNGRLVLSEKTQVRPWEVSKIMLKPCYKESKG